MLAPVTHIIPLATVRRQRSLPVRGTLLVRAGQKVSATDVIAETNLSPEHIALDVAQGLGVSAKESTEYIQRAIGEEVSKGGIVAGRSGLASRVIRAPAEGKVVAISNGQVLLEVKSRPFRLRAGLPGSVVQVEADRGATVEATGAWIQGVWGNGQINEGGLSNLAESPDHVLGVNELSPDLRGGIVLAGYCGQAEILEAAANIQIRGLILSSIAVNLLPVAAKMRYAIVVTEGFGRIPMNNAAHALLSTNASRETALNAEAFDRYEGGRPEIFIPLQASREPAVPLDIETFSSGQRVRIVRAPYTSAIGTIIALREGLHRFESGLRAPAAEVELENGEKAVVPVANIEVIG